MKNIFYTYVYLDPRKPGDFIYKEGLEIYNFCYEPIYIGKGCRGRKEEHWKCIIEGKVLEKITPFYSKLKSLYNKNIEPIRFKILHNVTKIEAFAEEIKLIRIIGRRDLKRGTLLNMTNGGEGNQGQLFSKETREKMSNARKGKKRSEKTKEKISKSLILRNETRLGPHPLKNTKCSDEHKEKISIAKTGNPLSKEHKLNMIKAITGLNRTDKQRKEQSERQKEFAKTEEGKEFYREISEKNRGQKRTEEQCKNISESQKGKFVSDETKAK